MSDVLPFKAVEETEKQKIVRYFSEALDRFEQDSGKPAVAYLAVLVSADGTHSVNWRTGDHPWPPAAIVGIASKAILTNDA